VLRCRVFFERPRPRISITIWDLRYFLQDGEQSETQNSFAQRIDMSGCNQCRCDRLGDKHGNQEGRKKDIASRSDCSVP